MNAANGDSGAGEGEHRRGRRGLLSTGGSGGARNAKKPMAEAKTHRGAAEVCADAAVGADAIRPLPHLLQRRRLDVVEQSSERLTSPGEAGLDRAHGDLQNRGDLVHRQVGEVVQDDDLAVRLGQGGQRLAQVGSSGSGASSSILVSGRSRSRMVLSSCLRRQRRRTMLTATVRSQASGASMSLSWPRRASARAKASWTASCASVRSVVKA